MRNWKNVNNIYRQNFKNWKCVDCSTSKLIISTDNFISLPKVLNNFIELPWGFKSWTYLPWFDTFGNQTLDLVKNLNEHPKMPLVYIVYISFQDNCKRYGTNIKKKHQVFNTYIYHLINNHYNSFITMIGYCT